MRIEAWAALAPDLLGVGIPIRAKESDGNRLCSTVADYDGQQLV